jgi:peptidoglycan-associated lipoprotein
MKTMNWKAIITVVLCVFLTTACSKKLMPPEIETSGNASESTDFTASSSSSGSDFGGTGGPGDSGFFSEEPILENGSGGSSFGSSSGNSSGSTGSGTSEGFAGSGPGGMGGSGNGDMGSSNQANIGNGSSGSFDANPFDGGSGSSGSSGSVDSGIQESRLQSFQASTNLKDIHFKFDQYDLDGNTKTILRENAAFLKSNPGLHVEIQGHCDERGTNNYNIALGERRAHSTKKYLVAQGVDSRNVHVISYGEEKPFCFSSGETCWHQNRRAHFMVSK